MKPDRAASASPDLPRVTVAMPAFNQAPFLGAAIDSVLAQSYAQLELIVVNDGSTDSTPERAAARAAEDPRITVVHQENQGLPAARNAALEHATGSLIAFLDADDEWTPGMLEACVGALLQHPAWDGVFTLFDFIGEDGRPLHSAKRRRSIHRNTLRRYRRFQKAPLPMLFAGNLAPVHAGLFRRDCVNRAGRFDTSLRAVEDYDLWLRVLLAGGCVGAIDYPGAKYRRTDGSMSTDLERMQSNWETVLRKNLAAYADAGATDVEEMEQLAFCGMYLRLATGCIGSPAPAQVALYLEQAEADFVMPRTGSVREALIDTAYMVPGAEALLRQWGANEQVILDHRFAVRLRNLLVAKTPRSAIAAAAIAARHPLHGALWTRRVIRHRDYGPWRRDARPGD